MVDWNDRSTCVLFGDGAGAMVVTKGEELKALKVSSKSNTSVLHYKRVLEPTPFITKEEQQLVRDYLFDAYTPKKYLYKSLIALAMRSAAKYCIVPMQDYLGLGNDCRMNHPSTLGGNWEWRLTPEQLSEENCKMIGETTRLYGRFNFPPKAVEEEELDEDEALEETEEVAE